MSDEAIKELILNKPSRNEIWQVATHNGSQNLFEDGLNKVAQGQTSLDELLRVVQTPSETA